MRRVFGSPARAVVLGLMLLTAVVGSTMAVATTARAQDDSAKTGASDIPENENLLQFLHRGLGWKYDIFFLTISFILVGVVVMNMLAARRDQFIPPALVEAFEAHVNEKRYQEAYEMVKNDESFLGKILSAGLGNLSQGYDQAAKSMEEVGNDENMKIDHRLSYISICGVISPMFGLLGTVEGMVQAFDQIARSDTTPSPAKLAEGIMLALVTTLVGLYLAIPAIIAFGLLKNRMGRMVLETALATERLMGRFQNVSAKK